MNSIITGPAMHCFTWNPAYVYPEHGTPIVCVTANGKLQTFKDIKGDWRRYAEKYNIVYWAYQSQLLPKIILNNKED